MNTVSDLSSSGGASMCSYLRVARNASLEFRRLNIDFVLFFFLMLLKLAGSGDPLASSSRVAGRRVAHASSMSYILNGY